MNIPIEIISTGLVVFGTAICGALGFIYLQILKTNERLARIEAHLGIETENHNQK